MTASVIASWRAGPATPTLPPAIRVHDLAEARAALAQAGAEPVTLVSAVGLAAFMGPGYWRAVETELGHPIVLDCDDDAGLVMAALRAGLRRLIYRGDATSLARLRSMAEQLGAQIDA